MRKYTYLLTELALNKSDTAFLFIQEHFYLFLLHAFRLQVIGVMTRSDHKREGLYI